MKTEKEINDKLIELEGKLDKINNLDGDHMQEYCEVFEQVRLIKWVLNVN